MAHLSPKTPTWAGIAVFGLCSVLSSASFAMSPYQAKYAFQYNNTTVGSASRTLSKSGNLWTYQFSATAAKMAKASETSTFSLQNGKIVSHSFNRSSTIFGMGSKMSMSFDSAQKVVNTKKDDKTRSYAWQAHALDELNAELQVREDLKKLKANAPFKTQYLIADAKEIESRTFVKQTATEKVQTQAGQYETVKVIIQHKKPNRSTTFWLAPALDYLPVKVSHQDGKSSYGLLLTGYTPK